MAPRSHTPRVDVRPLGPYMRAALSAPSRREGPSTAEKIESSETCPEVVLHMPLGTPQTTLAALANISGFLWPGLLQEWPASPCEGGRETFTKVDARFCSVGRRLLMLSLSCQSLPDAYCPKSRWVVFALFRQLSCDVGRHLGNFDQCSENVVSSGAISIGFGQFGKQWGKVAALGRQVRANLQELCVFVLGRTLPAHVFSYQRQNWRHLRNSKFARSLLQS